MSNKIETQQRYSYNDYNGMASMFAYPNMVTTVYTRFVSSFIDNTVSAIELANNMMFSFIDSWKQLFQQTKDNSIHMVNITTNTEKAIKKNGEEMEAVFRDNTKVFVDVAANSIKSQKQLLTTFLRKMCHVVPPVIDIATSIFFQSFAPFGKMIGDLDA